MKKRLIKPFAVLGIVTLTMFSCASTEEGTEDTEVVAVTDDAVVVVEETELLANEDVTYADLFEDVETEQYDVLTLMRMNPNFSTFVELVELSGLPASLQVEVVEPITLLAPTNQAFMDMDREDYAQLIDPDNRTELIRFVKNHILPSKVYEEEFNTTQIIETEGENEIPVATRMNGEVIYIGGAQIVKPDVVASNGIIHVMNGVVQPSEFTDVTPD